MAGSTISLSWREKNIRASVKRSAATSLLREIACYLVELPLVAVASLWIICLPLMYFALYGDLIGSVETLAGMTVTCLAWLMAFMTVVVSACLLASYALHVRLKSKWRKIHSGR